MRRMVLAAVPMCVLLGCGGRDTLPEPCVDGTCPPAKDLLETVFVDLVIAVSAPADGVVTVSLRDHGDVFVDVSTALGELWAEWMDRQREYREPIYLLIAAETRLVLDYQVPLESEVHSLVDQEQGVEVQLMRSAAIHFLRSSHPNFEPFLALLESAERSGALVLVTTDYDHGNQIIDVREPLLP